MESWRETTELNPQKKYNKPPVAENAESRAETKATVMETEEILYGQTFVKSISLMFGCEV